MAPTPMDSVLSSTNTGHLHPFAPHWNGSRLKSQEGLSPDDDRSLVVEKSSDPVLSFKVEQ
jgi:hypothetical protein